MASWGGPPTTYGEWQEAGCLSVARDGDSGTQQRFRDFWIRYLEDTTIASEKLTAFCNVHFKTAAAEACHRQSARGSQKCWPCEAQGVL